MTANNTFALVDDFFDSERIETGLPNMHVSQINLPQKLTSDNTMQYMDRNLIELIPEMESDRILEDIDALISTAFMPFPDTSAKQAAEISSTMIMKKNREDETCVQYTSHKKLKITPTSGPAIAVDNLFPTSNMKGDEVTNPLKIATVHTGADFLCGAHSNVPLLSNQDFSMPSSTAINPKTKHSTMEAEFDNEAKTKVTSFLSTQQEPVSCNHYSPAPNTSTVHITALISPTAWIAKIDDASQPIKRNRKNLTPKERAQQNRERNKKHAQKTRLRQKAYVEELKRTLLELVAQRDESTSKAQRKAQRAEREREVRFNVLKEFFRLKGENVRSVSRWLAILEDTFVFVLPQTAFRRMVSIAHFQHDSNSEANENTNVAQEQTLKGPLEVMQDTDLDQSFLKTTFEENSRLVYTCDKDNFLMDGSKAVVNWTAVAVGTALKLKGTMIAKFCRTSNKMLSAEIIFDTGIVQQMLNERSCTNHMITQPSEVSSSSSNNSKQTTDLEASFNKAMNESSPEVIHNHLSSEDIPSVVIKKEDSYFEVEKIRYPSDGIQEENSHFEVKKSGNPYDGIQKEDSHFEVEKSSECMSTTNHSEKAIFPCKYDSEPSNIAMNLFDSIDFFFSCNSTQLPAIYGQ